MNITDLSFDGLESCLQHLDIADLLNIADCNEQLRHAARYLIVRNIKRTELNLNINDWMAMSPNGKFILDEKWFYMGRDLKFCLQFLRCCGDLVSGMQITTCLQPSPVVCDRVINYVNEYCSEFLIKMEFIRCGEGTLRRLTKPFRKVEQIEICSSHLTDVKLSELFPNLRKINFEWRYCTREVVPFPKDFFTDHYPRLEHLAFIVVVRKKDYKNVPILLRANPQLKSLSSNIDIQTIFDGKKNFPNANEFLPNLEKLDLDEIHCYDSIDERIQLKNLKELSLRICAPPPHGSMWTFPFVCDQLESLKITVSRNNGINFLNRITNYPKIVKKFILYSSRINHMGMSKILPLLEEIDLTGYDFYFTVDEIVPFVREFRLLTLLKFLSLPEISTEELAARLGNAWSVAFESRSELRSVTSSEYIKFLSIELERYAG